MQDPTSLPSTSLMMFKLQRIVTPPEFVERYIEIVSSKKNAKTRRTLEDIEELVRARFRELEQAAEQDGLASIEESVDLQRHREELRSCYLNGTKLLNQLVSEIKGTQSLRKRAWCPYCGIFLSKSTTDHYMPATTFPEYSVHGLNLVPCCNTCNEKKGDRWIDGAGRLFVHVYTDYIPEQSYLYVSITQVRETFKAEFELRRPQGVDTDAWRLLERHHRALDLLRRYREAAADEIPEALSACFAHIRDGGRSPAGLLAKKAEADSADLGPNHWRVVLWRALSEHQGFCQIADPGIPADE